MDIKDIIKNNHNNVKRIIRLITKEENEDIEQEVYIKVWQKRESYQEQGKITGWIGTIAKNFSKDFLKKVNNTSTDENELNTIKDNADNPEATLLKKERQKRIIKAINSLKPKLKEVIIMSEIDGFNYEYIAKTLNCPIGTIKSRIYNAKKELAIKLEDML